jgi:hypothetical protein
VPEGTDFRSLASPSAGKSVNHQEPPRAERVGR